MRRQMLEDPAWTVTWMQPWARQEMTMVRKTLRGAPTFSSHTKKPDHSQDSTLSVDDTERISF